MSKTHRILTPRLIFSITAGAPYFSLNSGGPDDLHRFHRPLGGPGGGDKFISHIFNIFHLLTSIFEFKKIHYVKYDQKALLSIQIGLQNTFWFKKIMIIG